MIALGRGLAACTAIAVLGGPGLPARSQFAFEASAADSLAQAAIVTFQTENWSVRAVEREGRVWLTVYDKNARAALVNDVPAERSPQADGTVYRYRDDSLAVRVFVAAGDPYRTLRVEWSGGPMVEEAAIAR